MSQTMPIRVAVATKDRRQIDEHFGQAEVFTVYDVSAQGVALIEPRVVEHYCTGDGNDERRDAIVRALSDCRAIFAARIGDGPRKKLSAAAIEPVDAYAFEPVEVALGAWYATRAA
jgi:predicted Fe-Mo cluster-binding NifX family protein